MKLLTYKIEVQIIDSGHTDNEVVLQSVTKGLSCLCGNTPHLALGMISFTATSDDLHTLGEA